MRSSSRSRGHFALWTAVALGAAPPAVADVTWTAPRTVSPASQTAWHATVAMNRRSDAAVAWQFRKDAYNSELWLAARRGGDFVLQEVSDPPPPPGTKPDHYTTGGVNGHAVALAPDGRTLLAWGHDEMLRGMLIPPEQAVGERVWLSTDRTQHPKPFAGLDREGGGYVGWESDLGLMARHWSSTDPFGDEVLTAEQTTMTPIFHPTYALGPQGTAVAAYTRFNGASEHGGWAHLVIDEGDGWTAETIDLHSGAEQADGPWQVFPAVGSDGQLLVAWAQQEFEGDTWNGYIYVAERPPGGEFGAPRRLARVFYTATWEVSVAIDDAGNAVVAWPGGAYEPELRVNATAAYRPAGGDWTFGTLSATAPTTHEAPSLAFDAAGNLYAAWRFYDSNFSPPRVYAAHRPHDGHFDGSTTEITDGTEMPWRPKVVAGAEGDAIIAFSLGNDHNAMRATVVETTTGSGGGGGSTTPPDEEAGGGSPSDPGPPVGGSSDPPPPTATGGGEASDPPPSTATGGGETSTPLSPDTSPRASRAALLASIERRVRRVLTRRGFRRPVRVALPAGYPRSIRVTVRVKGNPRALLRSRRTGGGLLLLPGKRARRLQSVPAARLRIHVRVG